MSNVIVTLTGPSCSGKTTLTQQLVATSKFIEIISTTTRKQRTGEINGGTYHFVSREDFKKIEMLECIEYNGNIYGGSVAEFEEKFTSGCIPLIIVEPHGMEQINKNANEKGWTVINVFIRCPIRLQAERFLKRFGEEYYKICQIPSSATMSTMSISSSQPMVVPDVYHTLMTEYINRMVTIQTTESIWMDQFREHQVTDNSMILERFSSDNEQMIVDRIISTAMTI